MDTRNSSPGSLYAWTIYVHSGRQMISSRHCRSTYHTHPQRHRTESHKLNLQSKALHLAHDLIHIGPPLIIRTDCRSLAGLAHHGNNLLVSVMRPDSLPAALNPINALAGSAKK